MSYSLLLTALFSLLSGLPADVAGATPRIVNGDPTQDLPTSGALLVDGVAGRCSGTLVGCTHFITAAHCVCGEKDEDVHDCLANHEALVNAPERLQVFFQNAGFVDVAAVEVAPGYVNQDPDQNVADLAMLTLSHPVSGITPMPLNRIEDPQDEPGQPAIIAGFGWTGYSHDDTFGVLRHAVVNLTDCPFSLPAVCYPPPGNKRNATVCRGDSGGQTLMDFGSGFVLAGVHSQTGGKCSPKRVANDANVFRSLGFIDSALNGDTDPTCDSDVLIPVGQPGTEVISGGFFGFSKDAQQCRNSIRQKLLKYSDKKLGLMHACFFGVRRGKISPPCPDAKTAAKIAKAASELSADSLADHCPSEILPEAALSDICTDASSTTQLSSCLLEKADSIVAGLLDAEGSTSNVGIDGCQLGVEVAAGAYALNRAKRIADCEKGADSDFAVEGCPELKDSSAIGKQTVKMIEEIEHACFQSDVVQDLASAGVFGDECLDAQNGSDLAICESFQHEVLGSALLSVVKSVNDSFELAFEVPPGVAELRVSLNGTESGSGADVDLFLHAGPEPVGGFCDCSSPGFDCCSVGPGVYEHLTVPSPPAGPWTARIFPQGPGRFPYQVTVTLLDAALIGCGDGDLDAGEQCDQGTGNGTVATCCSSTCELQPNGTFCFSTMFGPGMCNGELSDCIITN